MKKKYKHLKDTERHVIETLYRAGTLVRRIAEVLGRSPNTVSHELQKNMVHGVYDATKAIQKVSARRWRAKQQCLKVALSSFLAVFVEEKLRKKWSPKQISGFLKREYGVVCSPKAVYKFAESRGLEYLLFWGWNNHKGGRKRGQWKTAHDGRHFVDDRPDRVGVGHIELDFIVSKNSSWVLLVAVETLTKKT